MKSHGIIYQAPGRFRQVVYSLARGIGAGLFTFAIVGIVFSFYPVIKEEIAFRFHEQPKSGFGDLISIPKADELGLNSFFSIYIPKINAKAEVIPNVNPGDYYQYTSALQEGVAHAAGTNFPGQGKLIYLFSHSTDSPLNFARFNAEFYLLRKLEKGDRIMTYFMGMEYKYVVEDIIVTSANDTSWIKDKKQGEKLVLQTCDPPGTTLKRLIVVANPVDY